ncbi:MAG: GlcNAc-PI de-N-acetylase, partial [Calditrichaeota bacterium]
MSYDILAIAAHPDDIEVAMGGTAAKLSAQGHRVLIVDLCDGEPSRHADPGERQKQAQKA